jgi:hypothetical protein
VPGPEPIGPQEMKGYMDIVFVSAYGTGASQRPK